MSKHLLFKLFSFSVYTVLMSKTMSPSDYLVPYPGDFFEEVLPLYKDAVAVFYCPSRLGNIFLCIFAQN